MTDLERADLARCKVVFKRSFQHCGVNGLWQCVHYVTGWRVPLGDGVRHDYAYSAKLHRDEPWIYIYGGGA